MTKEISFNKICLSALFLFGSVALYMPYKKAKSGELTAVLFGFALSVAAYFLWYFLAGKTLKTPKNGMVLKCLTVFFVLMCLAVNTVTAKNYTDFVSAEVLTKNLNVFTIIAFAAVCVFIMKKNTEVLTKFSLICFIFAIFVICFLFAVSFKNFKSISLKEFFCGNTEFLLKRTGIYYLKTFSYSAVFAVFSRVVFKQKQIKSDIIGLFIGLGLIVLCFLSSVLTFSLSLASDMEFSYPMSISVINVGELFTRMDGFAYFIFFFSAIIKASVCGITVKQLLVNIKSKNATAKAVGLMLLSFAVSYVL